MKLLKILPFLLIFHLSIDIKVNAQTKFPNDKNFKYSSDSLLLAAGINNPDFKTVDFEMRYWLRSSLHTFAHELFIVQLLKDSTWHLTHYQICFNEEKTRYDIISKKDSVLNNWTDRWHVLLTFNILTLPDASIVRKNWKTNDGFFCTIGDGDYVHIELVTKKHKHGYLYDNPQDYLKDYGSKFEELVNINKIIVMLDSSFNFDYSKRCRCEQ